MKGHPIIGKHWIWCVIYSLILRDDDIDALILQFIDKGVELWFGCIIDELFFTFLALRLVEVVGNGHGIAFESEGTDHNDCVCQRCAVFGVLHAMDICLHDN